MSELAVGSLAGLAANSYVIDVASGSQLTQPGMVLQFVNVTKTGDFSTTSTSATDVTGMSVTITPTSATSDILIIMNFSTRLESSVGGNMATILRITDASDNTVRLLTIGTTNYDITGTATLDPPTTVSALVSPATTSAVTYKLRINTGTSNTTASVRGSLAGGAQIYAMEIAN